MCVLVLPGQCCAHLQCAAWSEGVCCGEGQSLLYVDKAIDSGSTQVCFSALTCLIHLHLVLQIFTPSSWHHLSRCALTANDLELPCVATKLIVDEATTFHVQQQLELSRTGLKDTHFVQNIQLEVHTVVELPLLNFR